MSDTVHPINWKLFEDVRHGEHRTETFKLAEGEEYDWINGPDEQARELKRMLESGTSGFGRWIKRDLIYIEIVTVEVRREYCVIPWLTDHGEHCCAALSKGMFWNIEEKRPDIPVTMKFYEDELRYGGSSGQMNNQTFRTVAKLPSPEFDKLISAYVMRKLQSELVPGRSDLWRISA